MDDATHRDSRDGFVVADDASFASAAADTSRVLARAFPGRARAIPRTRRSLDFANPGRARAGQRERSGFLIANRVGADGRMREFSVTMINRLRFSRCEAPWRPITRAREELLAVAYRDDHLTLTELKADGSLGSRIYAQRSVALSGAMTFLILPRLPSSIRDSAFFPASGTVVVFDMADGAPRRLSAVGMDVNSGHCHGWLFDAVEISS